MPFSIGKQRHQQQQREKKMRHRKKKTAIAANNWWNLRQFEIALQCIGKYIDWIASSFSSSTWLFDGGDDNDDCAFGDGDRSGTAGMTTK